MMWGGLWQRPKRGAVCLLCRYRQRPTGSALRAYSEDAAVKPGLPAVTRLRRAPSPSTGPGSATPRQRNGHGISGVNTSGLRNTSGLKRGLESIDLSPNKPTWGPPSRFAGPSTPRGSEPLNGFGRSEPLGTRSSPASRDEFWSGVRDRFPSSKRGPDDVESISKKGLDDVGRLSSRRGLDDLEDLRPLPRNQDRLRDSLDGQVSTKPPSASKAPGFADLEQVARKPDTLKANDGTWDWAKGYDDDKRKSSGSTPAQNSVSKSSRPAPSGNNGWAALEAVASAPSTKKQTAVTDSGTWGWVDDIKGSRGSGSDSWARKPDPFERKLQPSQDPTPNNEWSRKKKEKDRRDRVGREGREGGAKKNQRRETHRNTNEDDFDTDTFQDRRRRRLQRKEAKERARLEAEPIPILLPELISVANLGAALGVKPDIFLRQLKELGFEDISKDSIFTGETAALVAQEYGFDPTVAVGDDEDLKPRPPAEEPWALQPRPPVVTIMGHVDHGKTTLLDYLRKSSIVSQEHGGITQHIGAFSVQMSSGKQITFLDTPGHAAFLTMRQRGANVTDMVILVVAADDSVKPQTLEALKHARAAKVPIIVAINKVDKDSANVDRVKSDLAKHGVEIEDFGGDVQVVCVSGKTGQGMDDLEENILLLAELLDIRAESDGMAEGWVLESSIKPIGRVATVLVKRGTLRPGDFIVAGTAFAKVRSLRNEAGQELESAPPGTAVEILGWKDEPLAGDQVIQAPTEDRAKIAIHYREELKERHESVAQQAQLDQDRREKAAAEAAAEAAENNDGGKTEEEASGTKMVNFTVKGDVHGSVEAVCASVLEQGNNEVRPRVLQSSAGQITEWDVEHAAISGSTILNFNTPVPGHIKSLADAQGVKILEHNVIYHLTEEVRDILAEQLPPNIITKVVAEAEILQVFPINIKGRSYKNVAGCKVRNGQITRNAKVRVTRNGEQVFEGQIVSLKQSKKEATEIKKGSECGIMFDSDWEGFQQGDQIQSIEEIREKRRL